MTLPIKLNVSADSLKEEVKCGFLVSNKLKKIQVIQVDLLNELLRVCRKHDIKLTVFAGTMLGAIRHKGFIPKDGVQKEIRSEVTDVLAEYGGILVECPYTQDEKYKKLEEKIIH